MVVLVFGVFESVYCGGCYFYVFGYIGLYCNDFGGKNQLVRLQ